MDGLWVKNMSRNSKKMCAIKLVAERRVGKTRIICVDSFALFSVECLTH